MKSFKTFIEEQVVKHGENLLDPDFEEKKERKDKTSIAKIEKKIEKVSTKIEEK